jgi:VWFA-related protein
VRKPSVLLASVLAATLTSGVLYAQQTPVPASSETIEVRVTNIDVVVTDSAGNPATGLTADDFEVLERGQPRPITNFYEVRATPAATTAEATTAAPADSPSTPGTAAPPATIARRRIIVYVDLFSVHPHQRTQMLDAFEKSLDRIMRPGDQAMLVTFNGVSSDVLTPLTSERAVLAAKLKEVAKRSGGNLAAEAQKSTILDNAEMLLERAKIPQAGPSGTSDAPSSPSPKGAIHTLTLEQAYSMARSPVASFAEQQYRKQKSLLSDLQRILGSLAGAEGKKVLLFLGGELVENPGLELYQRVDAIFAPHLRQVQPVATRDPSRSFAVDIRTLAETANANDVTMYMVDASSRGGDNDASTMSLRRAESESMSLGETTRAMAQVADLTGGIAVPAGKTIQTALDTIVRDLSSYYSLGYRSEEQRGGNIEVRVKKPGLRVRTRRTFDPAAQLAALPPTAAANTPSPVVPPALAKASDALVRQRLLANVFDDVPSDFPVTVTTEDDLRRQQDGKYRVTLNIGFPSSVTLTEHNGTLKGQVAVYIVTNDEDGQMSPVTATVKPLTVSAAERAAMSGQKPFSFTFPLVMQEGEVIVSVGVADQLGGTAGFAKTSVVAP